MNNLISKLENNVITELDLVQHKQLFVKLFGLFNFPQFNQTEIVLNLLLKLSKVFIIIKMHFSFFRLFNLIFVKKKKHKSAAKNIQEISGLQFLNALNNDTKDIKLKAKIEDIIESLMETLSVKTTISRIDQANLLASASCSSLTLTYKNTNEDLTQQTKSILSNLNDDNNSIKLQQHMSISINNSNQNIQPVHSFTHCEARLESISVNSNDLTSRTRNALKKGIQEFTVNEDLKSYKFETNNKLFDNYDSLTIDSTFYWLPLTAMDNQFLKTAEKYFYNFIINFIIYLII